MIEQIYNYFTLEMLYFWVNLGVLPLWLLIIFFPKTQLCKYLATSIFPVFLLSAAYCFVLYKSFLSSYDFLGNFSLYLGINYVADLFENNYYLLLFWIHFISINLFTGGWILKDSQKFSVNKFSEIGVYLGGIKFQIVFNLTLWCLKLSFKAFAKPSN